MHARAFTALAAAVVTAGVFGVPAADAATLEELITSSGQWVFEGDGAEDLGLDQNGNGRLDKGDTLRSIFSFSRIVAEPSGTTFHLDGITNSALHGLSEVEVAKKTEVSPGVYIVEFQRHGHFEEDFGEGAMAVLWESNTPLNPSECGTKSTCEAAATAGDIRLILGFDKEKQNVWGAGPISDDIDGARRVPVETIIGKYAFRMNVLSNDLGAENVIDITDPSIIAGKEVSFPAQGIGSGHVFGSAGTDSEFPLFNDANIRLRVVPIPAALPLFLAGLGALGMIGWRGNVV
jgi:hypothetical protein